MVSVSDTGIDMDNCYFRDDNEIAGVVRIVSLFNHKLFYHY